MEQVTSKYSERLYYAYIFISVNWTQNLINYFTVQFNLTRDSYFTFLVGVFTSYIFAKNTYFKNHIEWSEHKITILKPANEYQINQQCHSFKSIIFYKAENDKLLKQDDSPFKSLFTIWFALVWEKYFIKLCNSFSLTKFQVIPKFMAPGPLHPINFCIRINTSVVQIRPVIKRHGFHFIKFRAWKLDITTIILI